MHLIIIIVFIILIISFLIYYLKKNKKITSEKMPSNNFDNQMDIIYTRAVDEKLNMNDFFNLIKSTLPIDQQCLAAFHLFNMWSGNDIKKRFIKYFESLNNNEQTIYLTNLSNICNFNF